MSFLLLFTTIGTWFAIYDSQVKEVQEQNRHIDAKLNVLLTLDRPHASEHWTTQLPRLLEPQGVAAYSVASLQEAVRVATELTIHVAIVDLGTPMDGPYLEGQRRTRASEQGLVGRVREDASGLWVLELFRRLPNRPPVVVIHNPPRSKREGNWILSQSLHLGAFSVMNKPVQMEQLLAVFQRLVDRQYQGNWPGRRP